MKKAQGTPAFAFPWTLHQRGLSATDVRRFDKVASACADYDNKSEMSQA